MTTFTLETTKGNFQAVCETQGTRNGFKHVITVLDNNNTVLNTKINYINRTWESYEYQSILLKAKEMIEKSL